MSTSTQKATTDNKKQPRASRTPVKLADRIKGQLTNGVLRQQISPEELSMLSDFLGKLKAVVS